MSGPRVMPWIILTVVAVTLAQQVWVSPTNFGGADEWLVLDLASRGIHGVPYANRPLVLVWQAPPALLFPGDLRGFWLFACLYFAATGVLVGWLALRLAPGQRLLAVLAGVFTVAWAPLDYLRLDAVLICGYAGFTLVTVGAVVLLVESWHRRRPALLALGAGVGFLASLGVESVIPVLAAAPALLWREGRSAPRRFAAACLAWEAAVVLAAAVALAPLLSGRPSYQAGGLGVDPSPVGVGSRILQLLRMQAEPLFHPRVSELAVPAVPLAVLVFLVGLLAVGREKPPGLHGEARSARGLAFPFAAGLLLAASAHAALALTPAIRTPARTQVLSAPGFGLALAAAITAAARRASPRWEAAVAAFLGSWVVAVGTARVVAMQGEWDEFRSAWTGQSGTLSTLVAQAPGLEPGTLVLLLDETGAWPMTFTFRHALRYLYGDGVVGVVHGAQDFLYPWRLTAEGVVVVPWPVIRREWQVSPTFHPWEAVVVARRDGTGEVAILPRWPEDVLPALPPGARYAPREKIRGAPAVVRHRNVLGARPAGGAGEGGRQQ
jgi:hypothetical protein